MTVTMSQATKQRLAVRVRKKITAFSKGLSIILAAAAEPLMRYATIYLALATSLPVINIGWLYGIGQGIVIATPEFVIIGAFTIAEDAIKTGQKVWGVILMIICIAMAGIMIATFVDIFIVSFNDLAVKLLNFSRCLVAVGFTVALGKLDKDEDEDEQRPATHGQPPSQSAQPLLTREDLAAAVANMQENLTQQIEQGLQHIKADLLSQSAVQVTEVNQPRHNSLFLVEGHEEITPDMSSDSQEQAVSVLLGETDEDTHADIDERTEDRVADIDPARADTKEERTPANDPDRTEDKLNLSLQFIRERLAHVDDENFDAQLATHLNLKRPASARFWKLKVLELLKGTGEYPVKQASAQEGEQTTYDRLLAYTHANPQRTQKELASILDVSERTIRRNLKQMRESGQLPANWIVEADTKVASSQQDTGQQASDEDTEIEERTRRFHVVR